MTEWEKFAERGWGARREAPYDVPGSLPATRERLLDVIARSAFDNLRAYSNCCRSTLWALETHLRFGAPMTLRATAGLAGGIAATGETCGAVLGALMAVGLALGTDDLTDLDADKAVRDAAARFVDRFRSLFGTTRCWEIQEKLVGWRCDAPSKEAAWHEAGGSLACATVCAEAARLAARVILDARTDEGRRPESQT